MEWLISTTREQDAEEGEHPGLERYDDDVVARGPEEVLEHLAITGPRELDHAEDRPGVALGQHYFG